MIWFTSDTHFNHANIIKYCKRPFKDVDEMNQELVKRWNEKVGHDDTVYFLGDFYFKRDGKDFKYWRDQLNGHIVFFVGNHDYANPIPSYLQDAVLGLPDGTVVYATHNPEDCHRAYRLNLVGHVHEKWKVQVHDNTGTGVTTLYNVGVDKHDFYPISLNEILTQVGLNDKTNKM